MSPNKTLVCRFCQKSFSTLSNCRRHEKVFHNYISTEASKNKPSDQVLPKYDCQICDKTFSTLSNCRRHQKKIHGVEYKKHQCNDCEFSCSNATELLNHKLKNHTETPELLPVLSPPAYSCPYCEEKFSKFVALVRHKKMHVICRTRIHCSVCKKSFSSIDSCKRHEKNFHAKFSRKFPCSECKIVFLCKDRLYEHIKDIHSNLMEDEESLVFKSWAEFKNWKAEIEKRTLTAYIKKVHSSSTSVYTCHRSGYYRSKSKGIRHIKLAGTCKINSYCPASITVKCSESGVLNVKYFPTHLGHKCDVKHLRLGENEKEKIASQLITGVPTTCILNQIAESSFPTDRLAVTTAQDIRNVAKKYQINGDIVRNENDVLSVEAWINEMISLDKSPILLHKLPGEVSIEHPDLEESDFVLGFMNDAQEEILKIYGNEIICIDSTHGTNKYNIQLTSLLIKDDNWEGFPVAFLWSNRQHQSVFTYFFQKVKERVGDLKINSFMSDDYKAFYNAWCAIFTKPNFYLLCDWHVKRALKKNMTLGSTKIKNEKVNEILNRVFELINETDEQTFKTLLDTFKINVLNDPDTFQFGCYFIENYCNRPEQWAACYRINAKINTNMTVERWHKDLKYNSDLKGKCGGRLDKAIHSLLKNLRLKLLNRLTSLQRGKLTKKICLIRKTHKVASELIGQPEIFQENENCWIITSFSQIGETYKIKVKSIDLDHRCNLVCNICNVCIHKITCTCPNYAIKYNMCKHIHAFCIKQNPFPDTQPIAQNPVSDLRADKEKQAILMQKPQCDELEDLQSDAISSLMNFVPIIQGYSKEQCREFIKGLSVLKHKCEAIKSVENSHKSLPPVASTSSCMKKIKPQRSFPLKKKKSVMKLQANYNQADTLNNILLSKPETYSVAKSNISSDHTYSENV